MKKTTIMNQWTCRFALAGITLVGLSASAQEVESLNSGADSPSTDQQVQTADANGRLPITVTLGGAEQFKSDIDKNDAGSLSITRAMVGVKVPFRFNENFALNTTVRYGMDYFDFTDTPNNFSPWKYINTLSAASVLTWKPNGSDWSYYGGGFVRMSAESGVSLNRAANGGGLAGFNYKFSDTLSLGAGLAVMSQLEDDARVLPLITAKWQFADNWVLSAGLTDVANVGYGAEVKWLFNKEWDFAAGAQFHKSRFRINGDSANGTENGIGTEEASAIYVSSTWHASENVDLGAFIGAACGGKLKLADSSGNHEQDVDYKTAAILGVKASLSF